MAATLAAAALVPPVAYVVARAVGLTMAQLASALWRPALAAVFMAIIVAALKQTDLHPALDLTIQVVTGIIAYGAAVIVLWVIAGRPEGAENTILQFLKRVIGTKVSMLAIRRQ